MSGLPMWKKLFHQAVSETDVVKLLPILANAQKALLDRLEQTMPGPLSAEHQELIEALRRLRFLRHEVNAWTTRPAADGDDRLTKTG